jgi:hypothetical protein
MNMAKVRDFYPCLSVVFMSRKYLSENKHTVHTLLFLFPKSIAANVWWLLFTIIVVAVFVEKVVTIKFTWLVSV